jgi:hypothetical protein
MMRMSLSVSLMVLVFSLSPISASAEEEGGWVVGKWRQLYDPEDKEIDYLEFFANGDVISTSSIGVYRGFYIVSPDMVKAVLSVGEKDLILTFFYNEAKNQLRIVTSDTGIETIYEKVEDD